MVANFAASLRNLARIHLAELGLEAVDGDGHHSLLVIRHVAIDELQTIRGQSIEDRHRRIDLLVVDGVGIRPLYRYLADIDGIAPHALCNRQSEMQTRIDHRVELSPGRQYAALVFFAFLALGLVAVFLLAPERRWPLIPAAIFAALAVTVSFGRGDLIPAQALAYFVPLIVIAVGAYLLVEQRGH